jgi:type IV secretory pathway VirB2 component (pilin)
MARLNLLSLLLTCGVFLAVLAASGATACAQSVDTSKTEAESGAVVKVILKILVKWVAPVLAVAAILFGLAKGFKRGEWDYAGLCILAAIALALLPKIIISIFGINPTEVGYSN